MKQGRLRLVWFLLALTIAGAACAAGPTTAVLDSLNAQLKANKLQEAEAGARALLAQLEASSAPDSDIARTIDIVIGSLFRRGETGGPEGLELALRAVALKDGVFGPRHVEVAASLNNSAIVHSIAAEYATARPQFERAISIYEERLGPDAPKVASCLTNLANLLGDSGDYAAACSTYERALTIREHTVGPESVEAGMILHNLGSTYHQSGQFTAAKSAFERAQPIWDKKLPPNHPQVAETLNGLGIVLWALGDYAGAQPLIERAVTIWETGLGPESPQVAKGLNSLATVLFSMGDFAAVRPLWERALAINEETFGPDHPTVSSVTNGLGVMFYTMGDYTAARPYYERTVAIRTKIYGPDHPDVALPLMNLGMLNSAMGDTAAARPLFERALAIDEKALGPESPKGAEVLANFASFRLNNGDAAAARPMFERALAIREKTLGADHPAVAQNLDDLADLLAQAGDVDGARRATQRSLAIREKSLGHEHPDVAASLNRLATLDNAANAPGDALDHGLEAERITRDHLRLMVRSVSERQALQYAASRRSGLDMALTLAARGLDAASNRRVLDALVRSRAVVLDEMAARHRSGAIAGDSTAARLAANLSDARARLANLAVRGVGEQEPETYRKLLDAARNDMEAAERALGAASMDFVRESARSRIGLDEVAAQLPASSVLIAFAEYAQQPPLAKTGSKATAAKPKPAYVAFTLRAGEKDPRAFDLGPADALDARLERWHTEASSGLFSGKSQDAKYRDAGIALAERVWDPFSSALAGVERVFVVPDGSLNLVNLAALPAPDTGYLIERGPLIHYVSAERDLVPAGDAPVGAGLLAVGAPSYDVTPRLDSKQNDASMAKTSEHPSFEVASTTTYRGLRPRCENFASVRFAPLPATGKETQEIIRLWDSHRGREPAALDLRGPAASETALKNAAPGHRIMHLATHGFFLGRACEPAVAGSRGLGSLSEAPAAPRAAPPPPVAGENPLLLSGLALAGANRRAAASASEEDGILTAEEIASLDLSGVEWVVLSACETGVGDVRAGEGVFGLRRAFQVAGAGTLIMSLWSVDDEATRAWMAALYAARLEGGLDTAAAVRQATLQVLQARRAARKNTHPFFWAGFVAAGNWR